jgi:hypothetical protein
MTYFPKTTVQVDDSADVDAFSRLRVSSVTTLFDSMQQYGDNTLIWETAVVGTGLTSSLTNESTVSMSTGGTASGSSVIRQTKVYNRYQPGKSQLVLATFVMDNGPVANLRRRVGYFDAGDGIYFELSGSNVNFVRRTSASGVVVNNEVSQSNWNLDKLDGTGISGLTLDTSKAQILVTDLQWLGVGRVRVGFDINGVIYPCHQFLNANTTLTTVYMKTACLPIRYEITNTATTVGTNTMRHICGAVISEGGFEEQAGYQFSVNSGTGAGTAVTTRRNVLTVRAKTTGPNSVRNTGQILLREIELMPNSNNGFMWELVLNATIGGSPSWTSVNSASLAEYDTAGTTVAGGIVLDSGYVASSANARATIHSTVFRRLPLVYSGLNNVQDKISVVCTSLASTANPLVAMTWQELY